MTAVMPAGLIPDRIRTLAQFFLDKKKAGNKNKYVLMLGARASISSGVKLAQTIIEEIVRRYGPSSAGPNVVDTFDELWRGSSAGNRDLMLSPYL